MQTYAANAATARKITFELTVRLIDPAPFGVNILVIWRLGKFPEQNLQFFDKIWEEKQELFV